MEHTASNMDTGFPYSALPGACVLILGSMPSRTSLAAAQYYAHPRNAFWPIMAQMFGFDFASPYQQRLDSLRKSGIALWDVAHQCVRHGSLDTNIRHAIPNNFNTFFATHRHIQALFFNGRKAAALYRRLVLPGSALYPQIVPQRVIRWSYARRTPEAMVVSLAKEWNAADGRRMARPKRALAHGPYLRCGACQWNNHYLRTAPWSDPCARALWHDLWVKGRPRLEKHWNELPQTCLPSTSPAHAARDFTEKLAAWQAVKQALETHLI